MRVISLVPAGTDIVAALGAAEMLVGISHECDAPAAARGVARVTMNRIPAGTPSVTIDAIVREHAASGTPLTALDDELVAALRPEVILTQGVCGVCAVSADEVCAFAARLSRAPFVVTLGATSLAAVSDDVRQVATALGLDAAAEQLLSALGDRISRVRARVGELVRTRPKVALLEWTEPAYAAGHWVPEMIGIAGGVDVLGRAGHHSATVDVGTVRAASPDVVIVAPCGFDARRARDEALRLRDMPAWHWLRERPLWAMDSNALLSRPGPRLAEGIEVLAGVLHPAHFSSPPSEYATRI